MTPCDLGAGGPCRGAAWIIYYKSTEGPALCSPSWVTSWSWLVPCAIAVDHSRVPKSSWLDLLCATFPGSKMIEYKVHPSSSKCFALTILCTSNASSTDSHRESLKPQKGWKGRERPDTRQKTVYRNCTLCADMSLRLGANSPCLHPAVRALFAQVLPRAGSLAARPWGPLRGFRINQNQTNTHDYFDCE